MDALNSSSDIYLLGEANLHDSAGRPNFAEWYNAMHRQMQNPEYKSTYCPLGGSETATGFDTLGWLARRHKYVGEKLAFRSESLGYNFEGFLQFAARHFLRSVYICSLRNPLHVLTSCLDMFAGGDRSQKTVDLYAESCLRSIYLQLRVLFLFNQTYFVIHDRTTEGTFESLSKSLNVNLSDAWLFYDDKFVSKALPTGEDLLKFASVRKLCDVYSRLTAEFVEGALRPRSLWKCRAIMYELHGEFAKSACA